MKDGMLIYKLFLFICYPPPSLIVAVISLSTAFGGIDFLGLIVCNMVITREM